MSDLFGNHIVGFPTRRLKCTQYDSSFSLSLLWIKLGVLKHDIFDLISSNKKYMYMLSANTHTDVFVTKFSVVSVHLPKSSKGHKVFHLMCVFI